MRHRLITHVLISGLTILVPLVLAAQEGAIDPTFNPTDVGFGNGDGADYPVRATAVQPDGKIIIGGDFTTYNDTYHYRIARLNADGTLDPSFNPGPGVTVTQPIKAISLQADGKILIGGDFHAYNGTERNCIARINADGSLDASFNPGAGADGSVTAAALQPDGKIIIGGYFTSYNGSSRNHIARLNADGTVDATFNPGTGASWTIHTLALQPNGKVIIGGEFITYNGIGRNRIARLNVDGTLDASFNPGTGANSKIMTMALQSDGKTIIGGEFLTYNGTLSNRIARLNPNGSLDASFNPGTGAENTVWTTAVQPDGKIIIGGDFITCNGTGRNRIARLNPDGSLDLSFNPGTGANVRLYTANPQPNGKFIIGGDFTFYNGTGRYRIARLYADGSLDAAFNPGTGANSLVTSMALQPDGKVIIGGSFTSYNGTLLNRIARLNADGSLDASFSPGTGANDSVYTTAMEPNGKVIIGGVFTSFNGTGRSRIARLHADGSLDAAFNPGTGAENSIWTAAIQPDGKIIIGGDLTAYNGTGRNHIARLNADGSLDSSFNPGTGANNGVYTVALQPDGKIIIGGVFTSYNGTGRNRIARLNADGSLDTSFNPGTGAPGPVRTAILLPSGKLIIGGDFTFFNGSDRTRIARLNADGSVDISFYPGTGANSPVSNIALQPDGKYIIAGQFTSFNGTGRSRIARLNADGSLDASFNPGTGASSAIYSTALQRDGKILVGGWLSSYNGIGRNRIARIIGTSRAGVKVMLEGPYAGSTMTDALRTLPSFPLTEIFTSMGYAETGYVGGATIGSSVLTTTGNNAIVDWVIVEMRPVATPGTVAASRAVLLQRDGDVVDLDGVSTVGFAGLAPGNYCVAVKPRNHLPVMLSATTPVSYGSAIATVDFTLPSTLVYDNDARKNVGGVMVLAAGDVTFNEAVGYTGAGNDRDPILTRVGSTTPNNSMSGYWREDVNMDGVVKYTGSANDRDIILTNVGSTTPNNTRVATLP